MVIFEPPSKFYLGHTGACFDPDVICETALESLKNLHVGFVSLFRQSAVDVSSCSDVIKTMLNWVGTIHFAKATG